MVPMRTALPTARLRLYDNVLQDHFARHRQMALVSGPRQVGKTTTSRPEGTDYLNWDNADDRPQGHFWGIFGQPEYKSKTRSVVLAGLRQSGQHLM
jgi:hypothetical protein